MKLPVLFVLLLFLAGCDSGKPVAEIQNDWTELSGSWVGVEGGAVEETGGVISLAFGEALTAAKWQGEIPKRPFEIEFEARRVNGSDFFAALTFPARGENECVTFLAGGWGGAVVGISSIDDEDASKNETRTVRKFETGVWYRFRLVRVGEKFEAWIDDEKVIDVSTEGKRLSLRPGPISVCAPFGIASWQSAGEIRGMRWRKK